MVPVASLIIERPGTGGNTAEFELAIAEGYRIDGIRSVDARDESTGAGREHGSLYFGADNIIENDYEGRQIVRAAPEEDRAAEIEVEPDLEVVAADVLYIGTAYVDGEIRMRAKDLQRIMRDTVRVDRIVGPERDLDL